MIKIRFIRFYYFSVSPVFNNILYLYEIYMNAIVSVSSKFVYFVRNCKKFLYCDFFVRRKSKVMLVL